MNSNYTIGIHLTATGAARSTVEIRQVRKEVENLDASVKHSNSSWRSWLKEYGALGQGVLALGQILSAAAGVAVKAGGALLSASAAAQRLHTQLNFASAAGAARELQFIGALTDRLGLDFDSTAQAFAGFAAAARGTAIEGRAAREVFAAISEASAVMGLDAQQASGALLAVQQMMSKGVVSAEEFRGQLGERMPIALAAGARALGVTTQEFTRLMETGQIVAADFLPQFAAALRAELGDSVDAAAARLGDSVDAAAARLDASTARLGNAWARLKTALGDAGFARAAAVGIEWLGRDLDAIAQSMEAARERGAGLFGQLGAGMARLGQRTIGLGKTAQEELGSLNQQIQRLEQSTAALSAKKYRNFLERNALQNESRLLAELTQRRAALSAQMEKSAQIKDPAPTQEQLAARANEAAAAYHKITAGVKTASSIQEEYEKKLHASRAALKQLTDQKAASASQIAAATQKQAEYEAQITKERDRQLAALTDKPTRKITSGGKDSARMEFEAQIADIQHQAQITLAQLQGSQHVLNALHQAGHISQMQMLEARMAIMEQENAIKRQAIDEESAALSASADHQKRRAQLALEAAKLESEASAQMAALHIQAEAAAQKQRAEMESVNAAHRQKLAQLAEEYRREMLLRNLPPREQYHMRQRWAITDRQSGEEARVSEQLSQAQNEDARAQYAGQLQLLRDFHAQELALSQSHQEQMTALDNNWRAGAMAGLQELAAAAPTPFESAKNTFEKFTQGMTNALADFVVTGKGNFGDLAKSILADLAKMELQAAMSSIFKSFALGTASGGGSSSFLGSLFGFSSGGYTGDGGKYQPAGIVHKGEFVINAQATRKIGRPYLENLNRGRVAGYWSGGLVGASGAAAPFAHAGIENHQQNAGANVQVHVSVHMHLHNHQNNEKQNHAQQNNPSAAQKMGESLGALIAPAVKDIIGREMRPGGTLWAWKMA